MQFPTNVGKHVQGMKVGETFDFPSIMPGMTDEPLVATVIQATGRRKVLELTWFGLFFAEVDLLTGDKDCFTCTVLE